MAEEGQLESDIAQAEANIITAVTRPMAEEGIKRAPAVDNVLGKNLPAFGDTAYLEFGSQLLDHIRSERPDLYDTLVARETAFAGLVSALMPGYINFEEERYLTPTERLIRATQAPKEVRDSAFESARQAAGTLVNGIVREIEDSKLDDAHPKTQDFVAATSAVRTEIESGHVITEDNIAATAHLVGCVMAAFRTNRQVRRLGLKVDFDIGKALKKQLNFNQPENPKVPPNNSP